MSLAAGRRPAREPAPPCAGSGLGWGWGLPVFGTRWEWTHAWPLNLGLLISDTTD